MAETVRFLDGPLQGEIRTLGVDRAGLRLDVCYLDGPPSFARVDDPLDELAAERDRQRVVTYVRKPNHFGDGLDAVYALDGSKAGDQLVCMVPYSTEAREALAVGVDAFDAHLARLAHEGLARTCAEAGLVPDLVREVWRGTYDEAQLAARRGTNRAANHVAVGGFPGHPSMAYVVYEGVAVAPRREAVPA